MRLTLHQFVRLSGPPFPHDEKHKVFSSTYTLISVLLFFSLLAVRSIGVLPIHLAMLIHSSLLPSSILKQNAVLSKMFLAPGLRSPSVPAPSTTFHQVLPSVFASSPFLSLFATQYLKYTQASLTERLKTFSSFWSPK